MMGQEVATATVSVDEAAAIADEILARPRWGRYAAQPKVTAAVRSAVRALAIGGSAGITGRELGAALGLEGGRLAMCVLLGARLMTLEGYTGRYRLSAPAEHVV